MHGDSITPHTLAPVLANHPTSQPASEKQGEGEGGGGDAKKGASAALLVEPPEITGTFEKEGHDMFTSFQMRRWVMAKGSLTYYKDKEEKGSIRLENYRIKVYPEKPTEIKLKHPTGKKLHLRFKDAAMHAEWKVAFERHIEYYSKTTGY